MEVELGKDFLAVKINRIVMKVWSCKLIELGYRVEATLIFTNTTFPILLLHQADALFYKLV